MHGRGVCEALDKSFPFEIEHEMQTCKNAITSGCKGSKFNFAVRRKFILYLYCNIKRQK